MVDAFAIRKGMNITATKITQEPAVEVTQTKTVTGAAAPTTPPATVPVLAAVGGEEAVPAPAAEPATAPATAPEAASGAPTWLIWLLVLLVLAAIIWWYMSRKNCAGFMIVNALHGVARSLWATPRLGGNRDRAWSCTRPA